MKVRAPFKITCRRCGYFEAKVGEPAHRANCKSLQVVYTVNPGERHKLAAIRISGNHYFPDDLIRSRLQNEAAGRLFSHGRYSQALLDQDVSNIQAFIARVDTARPKSMPS